MLCNRCGVEGTIEDYYVSNMRTCKACIKARVRKHRDDNLVRIQEYDRSRPNHAERNEDNKKRWKGKLQTNSPEWREKERLRCSNYRGKFPEKSKAQTALGNAVRDSRIIKPCQCSRCPETEDIQGHHWSYLEDHWLDVEWLCVRCHNDEHNKLRKEGRDID